MAVHGSNWASDGAKPVLLRVGHEGGWNGREARTERMTCATVPRPGTDC